MKKIVVVLIVLLLAGAGAYAVFRKENGSGPKYRKAKLDRGDVVATVSATGTLSAVTTVNVGSQVSGIIAKLHADFNSAVKKGQLLAELDPTPFLQTVDQRRADLEKSKVELRNAEISLTRAKNLFKQQLLAPSDLDAAQTNRDAAAASVEQSQAALRQAETNLSYTKITSPIDGVVVTRSYDVGQTVAASFQAPVLFSIAQDLTKMQVLTNIDEADVGRIRDGQVANFTVDAFPDSTFKGSVSQIRLSPQIVQNVVTYPVMLDVPNPDLRLKPGMTANVLVPVDSRPNALRAPNAALRFKPDPADLWVDPAKGTAKADAGGKGDANGRPDAAPSTASTQGAPSSGSPGNAGASSGRPGAAAGRGPGGSSRGGAHSGTLYVEVPGSNGKLKPVIVKTALTDGNYTAIESRDLKDGEEIVVGLATARAGVQGGSPGGAAPGGGRRPF
jgi:HlyD family secretion protein